MQSLLSRSFGLFAVTLPFLPSTAHAQESFRNSLEYENINRQRQSNIERQYYNLRLGPVRLTTSAGFTTTYNDNINLSETNPESDFILRPSIGIGAMWQITEFNRLAIDADFGYVKYIDHDEYDRMDVSPGSTSDISYDLIVGNVRFNFHDRFFYSQDPSQAQTVTDEADLGRFRNSAGIVAVIPLKDFTISLGYDHVNMVYLNDRFDNSTYASEIFFARTAYQINPTVVVGLESSMGITDYDMEIRPDNRNYTAGPFLQWRISSVLQFEGRGGVSWYELNRPGTTGDLSAPLSYYASLGLTHMVNARVSHAIQLGRDTQQGVGFGANFTETMYARHTSTWKVIRDTTLSTQLFYEYSESTSEFFFFTVEDSFSRYGAGITLGYQLMERMNVALQYVHSIREGRVSFHQNSVTLALGYKF